jgi:hypothetical protein
VIRSIALSSFALTLAFTLGCNETKPGGTTPPEDAATSGQSGTESTPPAEGSNGEASETAETPVAQAEDPTTKECEAEVSEAPAALFAESMLIRLPKGLEPEKLVESTPMFVSARNFESVSCVEGLAGALVEFTAMGYFKDDPKKDIGTFRDEILTQLGYVGGLTRSEEVIKGHDLEVVVDVAADAKHPEPSRLWFVTKSKFGRLYYVMYSVHPRAWAAMRKTLKRSTDKMFLLEAK